MSNARNLADLLDSTGDVKSDALDNVSGLPDAIDVNASAPADSLAIDSSGNVGIGTTSPTSNLTVSSSTQYTGLHLRNGTNTSAKLIGFASGNDGGGLTLATGGTEDIKLLSGTGLSFDGGSNYLDDYEEGTFTPTYSGGTASITYDIQLGRYTKVGNLVTCYIVLFTNTCSITSDGILSIAGLPFTAKSDNGQLNYTGNVGRQYRWNTSFNAAGKKIAALVTQNNSQIHLLDNDSNASLNNYIWISALEQGGTSYRNNIDIVISYLVA